ncbi:MAG: transposase [archaeon]
MENKPKNTVAPYWLRFRSKIKRGGIWIGIKTKQSIPENSKLCDSFLLQNNKGNYEVRLLFEIPDVPVKKYKNILAVDFGEKRIATVVSSKDKKPIFLGKEVRGIRRHYAYLRKKLGNKKLIDKINLIGNKEKNIINGILHKISNSIIKKSIEDESCIVVGNLKGIRNNSKGKRFNRIVSNMPYYRLTQMIMYKAQMKGIKVIKIDERGTSRLCHRCGSIGIRNKQSVFQCSYCRTSFDADWNACINILNRSEELVSSDGAMAFSPKTAPREAVSTFNNL